MTRYETRQEKANAYLKKRHPSQGPCLVPKKDLNLTQLPTCHENDFCECELKSAYLAGYRKALEDSKVRENEAGLPIDPSLV